MWPQEIVDAWPCVYQRVYNKLRRWGIQHAEAEDFASESTLRAAEHARERGYLSATHCENLMYRTALHRAIDRLRHLGRGPEMEAMSDDLFSAAPGQPTAWEEIVRRCRDRLNSRQRLLLSMRFRRRRGWLEIADLLLPADDRAPNGRISAIRREALEALAQVRRFLEEEGLDPERW